MDSDQENNRNEVKADLFIHLLRTILRLTESEFGFIGSFVYKDGEKLYQTKYLGSQALGVRAHESKEMYTLPSHLSESFQSNKSYISTNPYSDFFNFPGVDDPKNLENYAVLPIYTSYKLVALVGVANRLEGYDASIITKLVQPAIESLTNLMQTNHSGFDAVSEQDLFKSFIKYTPLAVTMLDLDFRYLAASDAWLKLYKLQGKNLIGTTLTQITKNRISQKIYDRLKTCLEGKAVKDNEDSITRADGSSLWLKWEAHPWYKKNEEIGGVIIFCENITERKTSEIKMKKMLADLSQSNYELERFAHGCCHDMNEPLRGMASMAHLLMKHNEGALDETSQKYLGYIIKGANRLQRLIQDILFYSKIGVDGLPRQNVSIKDIIKEIKETYAAQLLENQAVIMEGFLPDYVFGNRDQISQVFQNLIENAVKFQSNHVPKIVISAIAQDENFWHFSIEDNGIGIEEEYFEDVFVVFKRLHGRQSYQGSGIGLSICQKIIEHHGGKIWISSNPDGGIIIHFTLPVSQFVER